MTSTGWFWQFHRRRSTGMVDLEVFNSMLEGRFQYTYKTGEDVCLDSSSIAIVCITHVPTNSGIVNPVEAVGERILTYNQQRQQTLGEQREEGLYCDSINSSLMPIKGLDRWMYTYRRLNVMRW